MNWSTGVVLVGAITWAVIQTVLNSGYKAKIDGQGATIKAQGETIVTLTNTVSTLEGSMTTVNNTIRAFVEHPPSALQAEMNGLKQIISIYHGGGALHNTTNNTNHTVVPDSINHHNMGGDGVVRAPRN